MGWLLEANSPSNRICIYREAATVRSSGTLKVGMKGRNRTAAAGFTLIELLVVIAIVVALAALVFMGVGRATRSAYKTESMNNIKQLSTIAVAGAADNQGLFPEMHFGNKPFWFNYEWREDANVTRAMAYSSANKCWTKDGIDVCSNPRRDLWEWVKDESSIFGYSCLVNDNGWADEGDFVTPDNWEQIMHRVTVDEGTDDEEIRWFLERTTQEVAYPILWMDISASWSNQRIGNFMKSGKGNRPEGVHVGYLDGSIKWINGPDMKARYRGPGLVLYW